MSEKSALALPGSRARPQRKRKGGKVPRGRDAIIAAENGRPSPPLPAGFREAWLRVCERVANGEAAVLAAHEEGRPLGLSGAVMVERVRRQPDLYAEIKAAREVWYARLIAEGRSLGRVENLSGADRVRAQWIQWELSKLEPTRFGDRTALDLGGQKDAAPIPVAVHITAGDARRLARDDDEEP